MKVLHVINSLHTGGAEKLLVDMLPLYEAKGIDVELLLLNGTSTPFLDKLTTTFVGKISSLGNRSVYNPVNILGLCRYIKKYDVVHVHLFPSFYWVAIAKVISRSKTQLVYTEHSISNRRFRSSFTKPIDTFIYKQYTKIVGITQSICDLIANRFNKKEGTILIENGVNINQIINEVPLSIKALSELCQSDLSDKKIVLQVSSFHPPKDQMTVIKSLNLMDKNIVLILVGTGHMKAQIEKQTINLGLKNRVFFLGVRTDVHAILKAVDLIVLSSKYEGMSLSSIEGMASGKAFVASDVPGLKEVVAGAGVLFPFGDIKKLAESITLLLGDNSKYDSVATKCLLRAKEYDISRMLEKHIDLYQDLYEKA
jgi:glycosyltransferase involved in cell wall biosynthesis